MHRVQLGYSRYFNRSRKRDGPLVRGRFKSKRVESEKYNQALLPYIEGNPVHAHIVDTSGDYEFSSAFYRRGKRCPRWLGGIKDIPSGPQLSPCDYDALAFVIENQINRSHVQHDDCLLIDGTKENVRKWMRRKAQLADGTNPGAPICDPKSVVDAIEFFKLSIDRLSCDSGASVETLRNSVVSGLLRDFCGLSYREIGSRSGRSDSANCSSYFSYRKKIKTSKEFADVVSRIGAHAIENGPFRFFGVQN